MRSILVFFKSPPSGAIPRFPVWEVTVMLFVLYLGIVGLLTEDSANLADLLGTASTVWSGTLVACGVIGLIGLATPAPNGLVINLAAVSILATGAGSVVTGLAIISGNPFFPGSTTLYLFVFGSVWRTIQLLHQLTVLQRQVAKLVRRGLNGP